MLKNNYINLFFIFLLFVIISLSIYNIDAKPLVDVTP